MTEEKGTTPAFVGALDHELFDSCPQELLKLRIPQWPGVARYSRKELSSLVDEAVSFSLAWNCLGFSPSAVMGEAAYEAGSRVAYSGEVELTQVILQQEIIKICENKWVSLANAAVMETGIIDPATAMESISRDENFGLLVDKLGDKLGRDN